MAYYKLVSGGAVLDAIDTETAQWVVENRNNYSTYIGPEESAKGVLSTDGSQVWHIHGRDPFHDFPDYVDVELVEIGEGEHRAILDELAAGEIITIETDGTETAAGSDAQTETAPVTIVRRLQEQLESLIGAGETPADTSLEGTRAAKIREMSAACNAAITAGTDVVLGDGELHHFSLTVEDQLNLVSLQALLAMGQTQIPYHADGEECRYFTQEEFAAVVSAVTRWKLYHESYFNNLKAWIMQMEDIRDINSITYGAEIPAEFYTDVMKEITGGGEYAES